MFKRQPCVFASFLYALLDRDIYLRFTDQGKSYVNNPCLWCVSVHGHGALAFVNKQQMLSSVLGNGQYAGLV